MKASQDREQDLPRLSICLLFQVVNYEHIHTHTHTQEHTHIWMGQGGQTGLRSRVWGSDGVPGMHHRHGCPHQGLLQHSSLQLCHPLGQRCQSGGGGAHLQRVEPVWAQPSEFCSSILGPAWPSRVGTATERRRSLCSHGGLALVFPSPSHQDDSCQHSLGRGDPAHLSSSSAPKPLGTQTAQGHVHTRTAPQNQDR